MAPAEALVIDSVSSPTTKRMYNLGVDEFFAWVRPRVAARLHRGDRGRLALTWRPVGWGPNSINVRTAVRKLAVGVADNGLLAPEVANAITRVKGVASKGVRLGNWLSAKQGAGALR